ncbi:MAG: protein-disulfide reductase DsbD [Pseudomonadota bacterium]
MQSPVDLKCAVWSCWASAILKPLLLALCTGLVCFSTIAQSKLPFEQHVLPVDRAFQLKDVFVDAEHVIHVSWQVAPGYYLYQEKFSLSTPEHVQLGSINIQADHRKYDPAFDKTTGLFGVVTLLAPINRAISGDFDLGISYQGCSERGFCYPPTQRTVTLSVDAINMHPKHKPLFSPDILEAHILWVLLSFFGFGLALSCTPCILPMVPIVFGLLTRMGQKWQPWIIVGVYVLTMACTYAIAGIMSARLGMSLQGAFQMTATLIPMSTLIAVLGLSQWGLFHFAFPGLNTNTWIASLSQRLPKDSLLGIVVMGILATLITSPCVTPPLLGALTYVAETQHVWIGGMALWAMGMGMGAPLLLFALFGRRVFPRSGAWMEHIAILTGGLLLALSISLLERIWFGPYTTLLWISLLLGFALRLTYQPAAFSRPLIIGCLIYAAGIGYYALHGNYSVLSPTQAVTHTHHKESVIFRSARTLTELQTLLHEAQQQNKPALLEFTADWCKTCQVIKRRLWSSPEVEDALEGWTLIRVDITQQTGLQMAMMLHYGIYGPPHILFFDAQGAPHPELTLVNWVTTEEFKRHAQDCILSAAGHPSEGRPTQISVSTL